MHRSVCLLSVCLWAGCHTGGGTLSPKDGTVDDPGGTDPVDTTDPTGPTGPTTEPCESSPTLRIEETQVLDGLLGNDRAVRVSLSEPAAAAVLCTAEDDPTERHLVESSTAELRHELRLQGLLPDTRYDCSVAPTCPTQQGEPASVTVLTGPGEDLPELEVTVDPELGTTGYWTLLSYMDRACSSSARWIVLYDGEGIARWWHRLPDSAWIDVEALYDPADHTIVWGGGDDNAGRARIVDVWEGEVYATAFPGWQDLVFSHDAKRTPDGRLLTMDYRETTSGASTYAGFGITLHDPVAQTVDFDLSSQRYVDEGWLAPGWPFSDPYHANWFEWVPDPSGDRLFVSLCSDWSILSLDLPSGDVRYKLGRGQGWTVLDEDGDEIGEDELPQCTHGNQVVGDDRLLVYDNGQGRSYTRIQELDIDPDARTVTRTWLWTEPDWHESTLGDVDDLGNGRILITEAHPECWSDSPGDRSEVVEVDRATGRVAGRLTFPDRQHTLYRAERYDGCTLMSSTRACEALAQRAEALAAVVGW